MSFYVYLQKNKKYGAVDNMTRTAKMSSAALRQYTRKNTITMTKWHEIKKSTRDGAVACDAQSQSKAVNHIYHHWNIYQILEEHFSTKKPGFSSGSTHV